MNPNQYGNNNSPMGVNNQQPPVQQYQPYPPVQTGGVYPQQNNNKKPSGAKIAIIILSVLLAIAIAVAVGFAIKNYLDNRVDDTFVQTPANPSSSIADEPVATDEEFKEKLESRTWGMFYLYHTDTLTFNDDTCEIYYDGNSREYSYTVNGDTAEIEGDGETIEIKNTSSENVMLLFYTMEEGDGISKVGGVVVTADENEEDNEKYEDAAIAFAPFIGKTFNSSKLNELGFENFEITIKSDGYDDNYAELKYEYQGESLYTDYGGLIADGIYKLDIRNYQEYPDEYHEYEDGDFYVELYLEKTDDSDTYNAYIFEFHETEDSNNVTYYFDTVTLN